MRESKLVPIVLAVAAVVAATSLSVAAADFKTGDMIDKSSWQKAEGLLPPEILRHYKDGEYANKFVDWQKAVFPPGVYIRTCPSLIGLSTRIVPLAGCVM